MRGTFSMIAALALAIAAAPAAAGEAAPAAETWQPVRVFIGSWSGARTAGGSEGKVVRQVESSTDNRQLVVLERARGSDAASWGAIAFDPARQALVLRPYGEAGIAASELVLEAADPPNGSRLVFVTPPGSPHPTRLTYELTGWNEFVERLEEGKDGGSFALVSETRFKRGNARLALKAGRDATDRTAKR